MSAYQVGSSEFFGLLGNFSTLLSYETDYYRQVADYETALAQIESLTGVDLEPAAMADASQGAQSKSSENSSVGSASVEAVRK